MMFHQDSDIAVEVNSLLASWTGESPRAVAGLLTAGGTSAPVQLVQIGFSKTFCVVKSLPSTIGTNCRGHLRTCQPSKSQLLANIKKLKGRCSAHDNHRNLLIFLYWPTIQITIELKFVMEDDDHDSRQDRDDQKRVENHGVMMML